MEAYSIKKEPCQVKAISKNSDNIIKLNVGGEIYQTSRQTLIKYSDSLFPLMLSGKIDFCKDDIGAYFIDRDGIHFHHILNYMRIGKIISRQNEIVHIREELLAEANFYQLHSLVDELLNPSFEIDKSDILTDPTLTAPFKKWFLPYQRKWFRRYSGSLDGWGVDVFHELCDGADETLTIIKSDKGHIFGGYTSQSWAGLGWIPSNTDFLFSLTNSAGKEANRFRANPDNGGTFRSSTVGPSFGNVASFSQALCLRNDPNIAHDERKQSCICNLKNGYIIPKDMKDINPVTFLAEVDPFCVAELEVFSSSRF